MTNSITLFGVALTGNSVPFEKINQFATKLGYLVHPDCCTQEVFNWLRSQKADFNSTFYKSWDDITSKSRFELYIDQIRHYATTYGTNFEGTPWIPNDMDTPIFDFKEYKVILPITPFELANKCRELSSAGINLSSEVVEFCAKAMIDWWGDNYSVDEWRNLIDSLTSHELQSTLYAKLDISPMEKFALLRYIAYKQTGSAMIVQSDSNFRIIKNSRNKFDFTTLNATQIRNLSSIFLRYKKFFLSFKNEKNAPIINKMRRLAKKTHTPLQPGFWENLLSSKPNVDDVIARAGEVSIFKLLTIITAIREHIQDAPGRGFLIRNQKYWFKEGQRPKVGMYELSLYAALVDYIKKTINVKVKLPTKFILTCPTSEKSFVGNYPFGTKYITKDNNAFVGIYWRNEWGTHDFDLSYEDYTGRRIGWNASYYDQDVIFSGDMTNADPEATEILSFKGKVADGIIKVNRYNGNEGSRYDLILGQEDVHNFKSMKTNSWGHYTEAYMVDPNNIDLRVECTSEQKQDQIGIVANGVMYLMKIQTGNKRVSSPKHNMLPMILAKCESYLPLSEIVTVVPEDYEGDDYVDLTGELHKDDIINLLTIKEQK